MYKSKQISISLTFATANNLKLYFPFFCSTDELFKVHNMKPNQQWRLRFDNYLKSMPGYYAPVSIEVLQSFLNVF